LSRERKHGSMAVGTWRSRPPTASFHPSFTLVRGLISSSYLTGLYLPRIKEKDIYIDTYFSPGSWQRRLQHKYMASQHGTRGSDSLEAQVPIDTQTLHSSRVLNPKFLRKLKSKTESVDNIIYPMEESLDPKSTSGQDIEDEESVAQSDRIGEHPMDTSPGKFDQSASISSSLNIKDSPIILPLPGTDTTPATLVHDNDVSAISPPTLSSGEVVSEEDDLRSCAVSENPADPLTIPCMPSSCIVQRLSLTFNNQVSPDNLTTAKEIVLDLLGWGVPPEYLVSSGVSPEAIYRIFTDLNLSLPTNLVLSEEIKNRAYSWGPLPSSSSSSTPEAESATRISLP